MSIAVPIRRGPLAGINPVAKLGAALVIALPLVASVDAVSALVALVLQLPLLLMAGLGWRTFWRRTAPVWIAAPLGALTVSLYGPPAGTVHLEWMLMRVTDGSVELAVATLFRVLAIALPGVVLMSTVDPTDLADGLAQRLRLPARFVLGALGGLRLVGLMIDDWRELETARRARGVADRGRLVRLVGMAFALLVLAIRRGATLATSMEARGFGASSERTWARHSPWGSAEWLILAAGLAISGLAVTASVLVGAWNPILSG